MSQPLIELLYEALNSELGIIVETTDIVKLRAKFYQLRKEDPALGCLSFVQSRTHPNTQLWIVRRPDEQDGTAETHTVSPQG